MRRDQRCRKFKFPHGVDTQFNRLRKDKSPWPSELLTATDKNLGSKVPLTLTPWEKKCRKPRGVRTILSVFGGN